MAPPLTPDQWLRILRAEGVRVEEYPGWRTRERDAATGRAFGPVRMFLNHHTAGRNAKDVVAKNGVPGLPAPLAHVYLARSGVATMCSAGRANHAGPMAVNAYASFRDEKTVHPAPSRASGTVDGNDVSYGIEVENLGDGKDTYTREQYDAWVRINAAVCRHHGWTAESVGCHKETSVEGKVDPRGPVEGYGSRGRFEFTPERFRADVAERLKHPASWSPGSKPAPTPPKENDMDLTAYGVWAYKGRGEKRDAYAYLRDTEAEVKELAEQVAELTATVARLAEAKTDTTPQG
ncbi:peptidoglycan recognition protein family protein [Streptomyces albogriseolus]|uniref:peptidoglycan recognition protein family protein n=1 Tax=Streptomyces albogriseolus TaxID=1887 RepID=UPI003683F30F